MSADVRPFGVDPATLTADDLRWGYPDTHHDPHGQAYAQMVDFAAAAIRQVAPLAAEIESLRADLQRERQMHAALRVFLRKGDA